MRNIDPRCAGRNPSHDWEVTSEIDVVDPRNTSKVVAKRQHGRCRRGCGVTATRIKHGRGGWSNWS